MLNRRSLISLCTGAVLAACAPRAEGQTYTDGLITWEREALYNPHAKVMIDHIAKLEETKQIIFFSMEGKWFYELQNPRYFVNQTDNIFDLTNGYMSDEKGLRLTIMDKMYSIEQPLLRFRSNPVHYFISDGVFKAEVKLV